MREEALRVLETNPALYIAENEHLTIGGQWLAYNLYYGGVWNSSNCRKTPKTCDILAEFKESSNSSKSQVSDCLYSICSLLIHYYCFEMIDHTLRILFSTHQHE